MSSSEDIESDEINSDIDEDENSDEEDDDLMNTQTIKFGLSKMDVQKRKVKK